MRGDEPADATDGANTLLEAIELAPPAPSRERSNLREEESLSWSVCSSEEAGGPFVYKKNESAGKRQISDAHSLCYRAAVGLKEVGPFAKKRECGETTN